MEDILSLLEARIVERLREEHTQLIRSIVQSILDQDILVQLGKLTHGMQVQDLRLARLEGACRHNDGSLSMRAHNKMPRSPLIVPAMAIAASKGTMVGQRDGRLVDPEEVTQPGQWEIYPDTRTVLAHQPRTLLVGPDCENLDDVPLERQTDEESLLTAIAGDLWSAYSPDEIMNVPRFPGTTASQTPRLPAAGADRISRGQMPRFPAVVANRASPGAAPGLPAAVAHGMTSPHTAASSPRVAQTSHQLQSSATRREQMLVDL